MHPLTAAPPPPARLRRLSLAGLAAAVALLTLWLLLSAARTPAWAGGGYAIIQTYANPTPAAVIAGGEEFGSALAYLPGSNRLIVGARSDQFTTTVVGQAFILNATTGAVTFLLHAPDPKAGDQFGFSVSAVLTAVVVGAPRVDISSPSSNDGAVYLFDATTGALVHYYPHPAPASGDLFGTAVAIISNTIVVGVPQYNGGSTDVGRVYLCSIEDSDCPTVIDNPSIGSPASGDQFGLSVVAFPGGFAVGAPLDGSHGTVYLYNYDGLTATVSQVISLTTLSTGDEFGRSLALVNGNLLIGAANVDTPTTNSGAAYLFSLSGTLLHTFLNPTPAIDDHFGAAVGGDAGLILIGAPDDNQGASKAGAIHLYDGGTYSFTQTLVTTVPTTTQKFGFAIIALGGDFAVSALNDNLGAIGAGAVYRIGIPVIPPTATATVDPNTVFLPQVQRH